MIKLLDILKDKKILVPRRSKEERTKNHQIAIQKKIQQYMKDGDKGDLRLRNTPITSLPPNLNVGDSLELYGTSITSLPPGLTVKGYLDLGYTLVASLPPDLSVGGPLNLRGTPLSKSHTKEQIKQMAPGVKGDIYF
jgi:hypothetical protein